MILKWEEHYTMGLEQIDNDHKRLFKIAGKIIDTVEESGIENDKTRLFVVREGVKYLKNYFADHAVREEVYMRQIGYPDYLTHKRLHDEFQTVQLAKFEEAIDRGTCTKEEVLYFVGTGIGWLLEHIATADMAIVGKGILCQPKAETLNAEVLEHEINMLLASTLNLQLNVKIINPDYGGEPFGNAIYRKTIYRQNNEQIIVVSGIEQKFLIRMAKMVYGEDVAVADALVLSTLEIFGATLWRTLGERLIKEKKDTEYQESQFLSQEQVQQMYQARLPVISVLFESEEGKFFVSSDDRSWLARQNG